jgi:hypothetical protein
MLSAVGAKSKRFRNKFPEQSRWLLPPDKACHQLPQMPGSSGGRPRMGGGDAISVHGEGPKLD